MMIDNLDDGEVIEIDEYRQIYDELIPGVNGEGYFIRDAKEITEDELTYDKVFDFKYTEENEYSHIAWYPD